MPFPSPLKKTLSSENSCATSRSLPVALIPSSPFQIFFPRGVSGCRRPAMAPVAPPCPASSSSTMTQLTDPEDLLRRL
eukprot:767451-Hanusia_phi.AAC.5